MHFRVNFGVHSGYGAHSGAFLFIPVSKQTRFQTSSEFVNGSQQNGESRGRLRRGAIKKAMMSITGNFLRVFIAVSS